MNIFSNAFLKNSIQNDNSFWYYHGRIYNLKDYETHGLWISEHAKDFGFDVPELEWDDDGSDDWKKAMKIAFSNGFIRVQSFNDMATISILNFSKQNKDAVFDMVAENSKLFNRFKAIEVMTLEYEEHMFNDEYDVPTDNQYIVAYSVNELLNELG